MTMFRFSKGSITLTDIHVAELAAADGYPKQLRFQGRLTIMPSRTHVVLKRAAAVFKYGHVTVMSEFRQQNLLNHPIQYIDQSVQWITKELAGLIDLPTLDVEIWVETGDKARLHKKYKGQQIQDRHSTLKASGV